MSRHLCDRNGHFGIWRARRDSNPRPPGSKLDACFLRIYYCLIIRDLGRDRLALAQDVIQVLAGQRKAAMITPSGCAKSGCGY